jgi:MurNAc alpha-1-phosphate uridylyltransferase
MKAMILAAGRGERMCPLTDTTAKPLLKVAGKALIEYHLEALSRAGVCQVVINHAWCGEQLEATLGDGVRYGMEIVYSAEKPYALETAGGIIQALPLLGHEPFIVVNGDIWTDYDYSKLHLPKDMLAHIVLVDNPPQHPDGDFYLDGNRLVKQGSHKLTFTGIGVYHPELFLHFEPGRRPLAPILKNAIDHAKVSGEHLDGNWFDIGTPERLVELDNRLSN